MPGLVTGDLDDSADPRLTDLSEEKRIAHPKVSLNQPLTPL